MKCILFGSEGYLGRNLNKFFQQEKIKVVLPEINLKGRIDLTKYKNLENIDWDVDAVFIFAGKTGTYNSFLDYENFLKSNDLIVLNILNSIKNSNYKPRIIFPSTRLVYKGSNELLKEDDIKEAKTIYAINKLSCENYIKAYENVFNIPYTIIRICIPYGNLVGDNYSFGTVGNFINRAAKDKIMLYGKGELRRTFTHIKDLCRILKLAAVSDKTINRTINMPGEELLLKDVANFIARRFSSKVEFVDWPTKDLLIESGNTVFDSSYLEKLLNTSIEYKFADWVKEISINVNK